MRMLALLGLAAVVGTPALAQRPADPDNKAAGTGQVPAGWSYRLDRATDSIAHVKFVVMGPGLHFTSGPAGIYWREADQVTGGFHMLATFNQTKAPEHPEAYGLFVAGKDLLGPGASYIYLLVRGDGMYTVRQGGAQGARSTNLTQGGDRNGWLANAAIAKQDAAGKASNKIEISSDGTKLTFKVNGATVHELAAPAGGGLVGIRMNHNLDVHVADFAVHKM
jgi:hypothetical protein